MKGFKKLTSVVVALAMVVSMVTIAPTKTDAAVKIIMGKKIKVTYGKTEQILVKGKGIKATSSNKKVAKVAKVKKSGKNTIITIKGVKTGKTTVKVKQGKSSKKVSVTVNPKKVTINSATLSQPLNANCNSAKVAWTKSTGATGYYVYYSTNKTSGFKSIKVKGGSKTSATVPNLALGTKYYFKVKAYGNKSTKSASYSSTMVVKTWKMAWSDEFNYTDLTKLNANWTYEIGNGQNGWGNGEAQYYTNGENIKLNGNDVVIVPRWDENNKKTPYTSTRMITKGKRAYKYGKVEFRAKLPKGKGTWAACWMLGSQKNWPLCGEIDVLETDKDPLKQTIPQTIHCNKFNGMPTSPGCKNKITKVATATSAYHVYGIEWDEQVIKFYIDGNYTWTYDPDRYVAVGDGNTDENIWPYNQPFYYILNCAVGGALGGDPGTDYWTNVGNGIWEDYMYVDYVRVYQ